MGFKIEGTTVANGVEVNANGDMQVTLPQATTGKVGLGAVAAVTHDGVTGAARVQRAADVSAPRRLRVGADNLLFVDAFSYAAQWTAVWSSTVATMTQTFAGGYTLLNGGSSVISAAVARMSTYKFFPLYDGCGTAVEFEAVLTQALQTSNVVEFGLFQASGTSAPTDGVFFRANAGATFQGVVNYAGAETAVTLATPTTGVDHSYRIEIDANLVMFWVDEVLLGSITVPPGQNGPCQNRYQPITARVYNSAGTGLAQILKVGEVRAFLRDVNVNRPYATMLAGMGAMGYQGQQGQTQGSTALYTNNLASGAGAAATNTTAALGSGLGGQFSLQPTLAAGTDGIISSFQVPAGTAANPGKSLVINALRISGVVTTAFTGGPCIFIWSLAFGHTAVSLATTETATTKAPRRIPLGIQTYPATAAIGVQADRDLIITFVNPIVVQPGEFVQTVAKQVGTVTSAGVILNTITADAMFE